ncbi:hypothetical protein C8F01DRAFT_987120 [Mycena amicta]|nr:hypothetical protein C8F01DRAFT_987120 [Mycena amicta]
MTYNPLRAFYMEADRLSMDAQFIVDSLPNAEFPAVERSAHQLGALRQIVSRHNIRIERLWRDIRKDSLEAYRQIFSYLEKNELLDMENEIHRTCLYLVFVKRIQANLDRSREAWNHHRLRTERQRTPIALFELSRETAIRAGYWTGDAGDELGAIDEMYGVDGEGPAPTNDNEPEERLEQPTAPAQQREAGLFLNDDDELKLAASLLEGCDLDREDDNWGIEVYCEAVLIMYAKLQSHE